MSHADAGPRPRVEVEPSEPTAAALADTIGRLRRALRRGARVVDPGNQLSVAQLELLACLAEHPGTRPGQLARLLKLRPNTVTTLVNALAGLGMISRGAADEDRRAIILTITDEGRHAVQAWQATNARVLNLALSSLTQAQRSALVRATPALRVLAEAVDLLADSPVRGDPDSRRR